MLWFLSRLAFFPGSLTSIALTRWTVSVIWRDMRAVSLILGCFLQLQLRGEWPFADSDIWSSLLVMFAFKGSMFLNKCTSYTIVFLETRFWDVHVFHHQSGVSPLHHAKWSLRTSTSNLTLFDLFKWDDGHPASNFKRLCSALLKPKMAPTRRIGSYILDWALIMYSHVKWMI